MIDGAPKIVAFAIDLHEDLVHVPSPMWPGAHPVDPLPADVSGEHRAEAVPPEPDRLVAYLDAALVQQILDIPEREREPNIHYYRQADDLGARLEVAKRAWCVHPRTLRPGTRSSEFPLTRPSEAFVAVTTRSGATNLGSIGDRDQPDDTVATGSAQA